VTFIQLSVRMNGLFMTLIPYFREWMVHSWRSFIICQVERSVHDFMSLYVRLNGLFMTYVIICQVEWSVHDFYVIICQVEWSVHDFMSSYVRLNGLFMTLCHYMSGWIVHLWLCFHHLYEWMVCSRVNILFFVWMNGLSLRLNGPFVS
jgi:hypothetical protein